MGFISELFGYVLNALYNLISNYGIAIIIFSVLLRLILIPITIKQQKTMKKSNEMQQEMKNIQAKYKNNPEKLNQETMELYKREGLSPFSGCFTAILQLLIILSEFCTLFIYVRGWLTSQNTEIYKEYKTAVEGDSSKSSYKEIAIINKASEDYQNIINELKNENVENREELENRKAQLEELRINMEFLGLDLSKVPTQSLNDWKVYIIPILYVITSFISIRITTKTQMSKSKNGEEEKTPELESMEQMNKSMSYMMPIMSISIAVIAPLGLALYWLVSNILMIVERLVINKFMSSKEEKENA